MRGILNIYRISGLLLLLVYTYFVYRIFVFTGLKQTRNPVQGILSPIDTFSREIKKKKSLTIVTYNPNNDFPFHMMTDYLPETCPYRNCLFTTNRTNLRDQAAIIYILTHSSALPYTPPISPADRRSDQIWIFTWMEPPPSHFTPERQVYMNGFWKNTVNWTMTYTYDSDIFFPYGEIRKRNVVPNKNFSEIFHKKTRMALWLVSNCQSQSKREVYVEQLKKHGVQVDIYGGCGEKSIDTDVFVDTVNKNYKFYIAFENSFCKDYITEKFYFRFDLDTILIVRGSGNYSRVVPNDAAAYINTADFDCASDVAKYMLKVAADEALYTEYMQNKNKYEFFYMTPWREGACTICSRLNELDKYRRIYTDLVGDIHGNTCHCQNDLPSVPC